MKITEISVKNLFGIFNHKITLNNEERITIIHGPNGFGKTAILRLIDGFFNSHYFKLRKIPFSQFEIKLSNNETIEIVKELTDYKNSSSPEIVFYLHKPHKPLSKLQSFSLHKLKNSHNLQSLTGSIENLIPGLERISSEEWAYIPTNEIISSEDVIERFGDYLPSEFFKIFPIREEPDWLKEIKNSIHIRLVESQRLLNIVTTRSSRRYEASSSMFPTVSAYSDELAKLMQDKFKEYGTTSQSLDRTFPVRVVKQPPSVKITDEQLRQQLKELEITRSRLIEVGLLDEDREAEFQIQPQDIDESTKNALSVYVEDVEKKLNVFSEITQKIELLRKIINSKFAYS
ncbi:MAG: AAA family ATPase, partial [Jaaginema sp. PMC 1078.18]|nr:AAA family ATPase [Jaaginema sp. PMC 1078.18]